MQKQVMKSRLKIKTKRKKKAQLFLIMCIVGIGLILFKMTSVFFLYDGQETTVTTSFVVETVDYLQQDQETAKLPLLLQRDERWAKLHYGSERTTNTLAKNGCGIVSLAMVLSYFQNQEVTPKTILEWSHDDYYLTNQGTSWTIFSMQSTIVILIQRSLFL